MQEKHWQAQNQQQNKSPKAPKKVKRKKQTFLKLIEKLKNKQDE